VLLVSPDPQRIKFAFSALLGLADAPQPPGQQAQRPEHQGAEDEPTPHQRDRAGEEQQPEKRHHSTPFALVRA